MAIFLLMSQRWMVYQQIKESSKIYLIQNTTKTGMMLIIYSQPHFTKMKKLSNSKGAMMGTIKTLQF